MSRQFVRFWSFALTAIMFLSGCHPTQPFYLFEDGDLSHYVDVATEIEHPDIQTTTLPEASQTNAPLTVLNPEFDDYWDLQLEDAVCMALHNSKVIRQIGAGFGGSLVQSAVGSFNGAMSRSGNLLAQPEFVQTIYEPAIQETDSNFGVEAALSAFDTQFAANLFWDRRDRPRNFRDIQNQFFTSFDHQDTSTSAIELSKRTAPGTVYSVRANHQYDLLRAGSQALSQPRSSFWTGLWELEARHPLKRGGGVQVNRIPIVVARIRTDIALADFEESVRDMVSSVEQAYWELHFCYRALDAEMQGRDSALVTWKKIDALAPQLQGGEADKLAQARQQYFEFQGRVQATQGELFKCENRLRFLLGLAASDSRMIRPIDEPTTAQVAFDWHQIISETLTRSVELRAQKWRIKQRELELIAARNTLLPQLDIVGLYRWLGLGDDLLATNRRGINFPLPESSAYGELTGGNYQEFRVGLEMGFPVGFRRELSGVRNNQLRLVRDKAVLADMELEASHELTDAIQNLEGNYVLMQTNFNTLVAAHQEVEAVQAAYEAGTVTLDLLLDAQRRRSQAERSYFRSLTSYNQSIAQVHRRKGSLLEYNGIRLAEGPWPDKAYWDAHAIARRRDSSTYMDYGFTRPKVISSGNFPQQQKTSIDKEHPPTTSLQQLDDSKMSSNPQHDHRAIVSPHENKLLVQPGFEWGNLGLNEPGSVQTASGQRLDTSQQPGFEWGNLGLNEPGSVQTASGQRLDTSQQPGFEWGNLGLNEPVSVQTASGQRPDTSQQ